MAAIGIGPSLTPRRERSRAAFDFSAGTLPRGAVLTRASAATRFDAAGVLVSEPADRARFDHDPATGRLRGLLIEGETTNLALHSSAFAEPAWTLASAAVSSSPNAAPDGSGAATVLTDGGAGFASIAQNVASAGSLVASIFVRKDAVPAETRYALLRLAPPQTDVRFDTMTGATSGSAGGHGAIDSGDHWRVWRSVAPGATSVSLFPAVGSGGLASGYAMAAMGSITIWGVQVEPGSEPTSFIASGAQAATRAPDRLRLDWGMHGAADGPLIVRYRFDDGSSETATMTIAGGIAEVPTTLMRRHLMRVERI